MGLDAATGNRCDVALRNRESQRGCCIHHFTESGVPVRLPRGRQAVPEDVDPVAEHYPRPDGHNEAGTIGDVVGIEYASDRGRHLRDAQRHRFASHGEPRCPRQESCVDRIGHAHRALAQRGDLIVRDLELQVERRDWSGHCQWGGIIADLLA
ncbi:hypothetical protein D3C81_970100 [compost metagenome]